ncbi:MAG: tRNA (guanosine(37)-N1)-methyltransferase TrmD, partial [Rhizobiales bacterium]|nr:tRNA (guanosine(37)-N1)-methyltransferase TrmD [Hyphomicrobiales bacterium]
RPQLFEGQGIPEVLTSGDHARIARWRQAEAEAVTRARRPDLLPPVRDGSMKERE